MSEDADVKQPLVDTSEQDVLSSQAISPSYDNEKNDQIRSGTDDGDDDEETTPESFVSRILLSLKHNIFSEGMVVLIVTIIITHFPDDLPFTPAPTNPERSCRYAKDNGYPLSVQCIDVLRYRDFGLPSGYYPQLGFTETHGVGWRLPQIESTWGTFPQQLLEVMSRCEQLSRTMYWEFGKFVVTTLLFLLSDLRLLRRYIRACQADVEEKTDLPKKESSRLRSYMLVLSGALLLNIIMGVLGLIGQAEDVRCCESGLHSLSGAHVRQQEGCIALMVSLRS